jgi:hypothetical protein
MISGLFDSEGIQVGNDQLEGGFVLQYAALVLDLWPENTLIWDWRCRVSGQSPV